MKKFRTPFIILGVIVIVALAFLIFPGSPKRIGPVSQYGQLRAGKNSAGEGRIYGSCIDYSTSGNEVQVKGMSLFWSINEQSAQFYERHVIAGLVEKQNIQLIRAAMGVDEDWGAGNFFTNEPYYQALLDSVVQAAIDLDIYVVIDYHSHRAHENVENAKKFFEKNAQKWGAYDNVIFDIYNEPACIKNGNGDCFSEEFGSAFVNWNTIKDYSDQVIEVIRKYSDNLIIVGTPVWSQRPDEAINAPVKDPANNVAYGFHFYAGSHTVRGWGIHPEKAIKKGIALFVGEWGTVNAVIKGKVSPNNTQWQMWMNRFKLSSANWSLTNLVEDQSKADNSDGQGGSYFAADFDPKKIDGEWKYSESGKWVNENVFKDLPTQYKKCTKYVQSEFVKP